ncbi:hypothetical protein WG66_005910 [Moniliophthora roreri]|nr:hypothetical protein WG66_005910 [Moniliophthora roreri]
MAQLPTHGVPINSNIPTEIVEKIIEWNTDDEEELRNPTNDNPIRVTPAVIQFLHSFPNLKKVDIRTSFPDLHHLQSFISKCGHILELSLEDDVEWQSQGLNGPTSDSAPLIDVSSLHVLDIFVGEHSFDQFLHALSPSTNLRTLIVRFYGLHPSRFLPLLANFSGSLCHLKLNAEKERALPHPRIVLGRGIILP